MLIAICLPLFFAACHTPDAGSLSAVNQQAVEGLEVRLGDRPQGEALRPQPARHSAA
ncbi:MAG TPA: hypothetical protein VMN37_08540 [Gemmatimonadales bacterium]|nr:hypothetical protein [Gemmatimonadales bacterium]